MKRKNLEQCIPLEILKKVSSENPEIWDDIEKARKVNMDFHYSLWPQWCYVPVSLCMDLVSQNDISAYQNEESLIYARKAQIISALASWRASKEIFVLDPDVEKILSEQDDTKVDPEILLKLPYDSFYIKTNFLDIEEGIDGFLVSLDYDKTGNEIRFTYLCKDLSYFELPLILNYETIQQTLDVLFEDFDNDEWVDDKWNHKLWNILNSSLQFVLYILSVNAEIKENETQKKVYKPSNGSTKVAKDKYSQIRKWDVGYRIGATIRANRAIIEQEREYRTHPGSHSSKRPHMRRGHWHNYWTGPRKGERKLVLKWVPPMFIGAKENAPVVYHEVK